jgi:hypothetical protein
MERVRAFRLFLISIVAVSASLSGIAKANSTDPAFSGIPLNQWIHENPRAHINWKVSMADVRLSMQQRLFSRFDFIVDGRELDSRRGRGKFVLLVQLTDDRAGVWQSHYTLNLERVVGQPASNNYEFSQPFFILPGDYTITAAVYDPVSGDHGAIRRKIHVNGLKNDIIPDSWRNLPAVEFIEAGDPPDVWFLPNSRPRLYLPAKTELPTDVDVIVNLSPSGQFFGSPQMWNRTMQTLLPCLKVLSQIDWGGGKLNIEILDLARKQVLYEGDDLSGSDWTKARSAIQRVSAPTVDVKSLESRQEVPDFFTGEIGRRAQEDLPAGHARVIVVLSSAVALDPSIQLRPLDTQSKTDQKIFYFRFEVGRSPVFSNDRSWMGRPMGIGVEGSIRPGPTFDGVNAPAPSTLPDRDALESLIRDLNPVLFNFTTPGDFRKGLARLLREPQTK